MAKTIHVLVAKHFAGPFVPIAASEDRNKLLMNNADRIVDKFNEAAGHEKFCKDYAIYEVVVLGGK